ncbi:MAG: DNA polymerase III subunit gamma/tau [Candidatus Gastranaerophilales bacterium]|nr:DNA polymerase III subunit gamma/tau [Candidatus Gastranaerophilales bacterium]
MSEKYVPLYRKYRPQTFYDLIGQENIVNALSNAIKLNRIAHAYLLCGPRGTGKTSSARILAKSLNCKEGPTLKPCGKCPSCLDIMNSVPVDVVEIDAASNRSVEDTQAILEKIQYVPVNGRYKIYVIDEVHMLSNHAFNALLKTLEEPPENVIFILATTEPHKVLETIISRCQRFDFRRITTEDIVKRLSYISEQEKINIAKEALYSIAKNSAGGMRDAVALLDQISVLGQNKEINIEDINELLGKISFEMLFDITTCIIDSDSAKAIELIDKIYNKGNEPIQIVNNLIQYFRDLMILKNCNDKSLVLNLTQLNENSIEKSKPQAESFEPEQIIALIDKLSYYATQIKETTNKYLWLELCLIDIANNQANMTVASLTKRIDLLESQIANGSPITAAPQSKALQPVKKPVEPHATQPIHSIDKEPQKPIEQTEPTETKKPASSPQKQEVKTPQEVKVACLTDGDIRTTWHSLLENIESMPSRAFYSSLARPIEITPEKVTISFAKDIFVRQAKEDTKKLPLENAAKKFFSVASIKIEVHLSDGTEPEQNVKKKVELAPKSDTDDNEIHTQEEEEYLSQMMKKDAPLKTEKPADLDESDQAKMFIQLFDGKYID